MKRIAVPLLCLTLAVPARAQDTASVSGCYRFDRAYFTWVGRRPGQSSVIQDSTAILRLSPTSEIQHSLVRGPVLDVYAVPFVADSSTVQRWLQPSNWTFETATTINVVWRNGLYGPVFWMAIHGDTLRGQVRFTTDLVGAEPPPESAVAVQIACPAQL